jgi:hypothetical protein
MQAFLFHAHSGLRYLVLLAAVIAAGYSIVGWVRARGYDRPARILGTVFVGLLDLQVVVGLVLLIVWPFYPALIGHITLMGLALVVAHATAIGNRRRPEGPTHPRQVIGIALTLFIVVAGILAIGRPIV